MLTGAARAAERCHPASLANFISDTLPSVEGPSGANLAALHLKNFEAPMDDSQNTSSNKTAARRRLLRGSFALPAALAVHNGSALAQASNKLRCMINAVGGNYVYPIAVSDSSLGALQGRVTLYQVPATPTVPVKYYIKASELQAVGTLLGGWVAPQPHDTHPGTYATWVRYNTATTAYKYVNPGLTEPAPTSTRIAVCCRPRARPR